MLLTIFKGRAIFLLALTQGEIMATRSDYKIRGETYPLKEFEAYIVARYANPGTRYNYLLQVRRLLILTEGNPTEESLDAAYAQVPGSCQNSARIAWRHYSEWMRARGQVVPLIENIDAGKAEPWPQDAKAALALIMALQPKTHGITTSILWGAACSDVSIYQDPLEGFELLASVERGSPRKIQTAGLDARVAINVILNHSLADDTDPFKTALMGMSPGDIEPMDLYTVRNYVRQGRGILRDWRRRKAREDGPLACAADCWRRSMEKTDPWWEPGTDPLAFVEAHAALVTRTSEERARAKEREQALDRAIESGKTVEACTPRRGYEPPYDPRFNLRLPEARDAHEVKTEPVAAKEGE
jgi:hypothetical protein